MQSLILLPFIALAAPAPARVADDLAPPVANRWQVESGQWTPGPRLLVCESASDSIIWRFTSPEFASGTITASVTPVRRLPTGSRAGWAAAGLLLYQDPANFWNLALVEGPSGQRYCELVEMLNNVWQAQQTAPSVLERVADQRGSWDYDKPYQLRITVRPPLISAAVIDARSRKRVFATVFRVPQGVPSIICGRPGLRAMNMQAQFGAVSASGQPRHSGPAGQRGAAILAGPGGLSKAAREAVIPALRAAGLVPSVVSARELPRVLSSGQVGVLVLPWVKALPAASRAGLHAFLGRGGKMLVLGPPPFEKWAFPSADGRLWRSRQELLAFLQPSSIIADFAREDLSRWSRSTDTPGNPAQTGIVDGPPGAGRALRVRMPRVAGWDTLGRTFSRPFPGDHSLTCFWARGDHSTTGLILEWRETDGSRWIANVPVTNRWRRYALSPSDFPFWRDGSPLTRGGPGDRFNPARADFLSFGVARSHLGVEGPSQEYLIAQVATARDPTAGIDTTPLTVETMSPWHKIYQTSATRVRPWPDPSVILSPSPCHSERSEESLCWLRVNAAKNPTRSAPSTSVTCSVPRARSWTFDRRPLGRWVPFLEAIGSDGRARGACGWCYFPLSGTYRGAAWGCIGLTESAPASSLRGYTATALKVLLRDAVIARAGSRHWSYFEGERPDFGAEIVNSSGASRSLRVRWTIARGGKCVFRGASSTAPGPGESVITSPPTGASAPLPPGRYRVAVELLSGGREVDSLSHEFTVIPNRRTAAFVKTSGGRFTLNGREWYPHGVNYWPSYVAGMEAAQYWGHWLHPAFYDPETVEKDLALLERLGANAVSVQCNAADHLRPLNDFLIRARAHGIRANVFLNGAHPLYPDEKLVTTLMKQGRLAQSDAIFAYDIAWEPAIGRRDSRRNWNREWNRWIDEQYGSLADAAKWWDFKPEMRDGLADAPSDDQLMKDGSWRIYVAAYRRFADDLISRRYGRITRVIRKLDPNHLIGARTGYGGTGQIGVAPAFPFDLVSGAKHLDFVSPEGWGLFGPWKDFREAGFTTAYGRWASNGKPVFWSEFGATLYPQYSKRKLTEQARIYQHMYRMVLDSDADGSAGWWFPGGLRIDENSDYGIINPDGTPRPSALALQAYASRIKRPRGPVPPPPFPTRRDSVIFLEGTAYSPAGPPSHLIQAEGRDVAEIVIDRDQHVTGYAGVWEHAKAAYLAARKGGKRVVVETAGTGGTTAYTSFMPVGNTPARKAPLAELARTTRFPFKHVNAEFNFLLIKNVRGVWQQVEDGDRVEIAAGNLVQFRAGMGNTGEATWLLPKPDGPSGVHLLFYPPDGSPVSLATVSRPVRRYQDIVLAGRFGTSQSAPRPYAFRLWIPNIGEFGEKRHFTLVPVPPERGM